MRLTAICTGALLPVGCVSATHTVRFSGAELPNGEFFGDLRVVRARASIGATGNAGYEYWWETDLKRVNAIHFRLVLQHDRSSAPAMDHEASSSFFRSPASCGTKKSTDFDSHSTPGKHYHYELIGKIEEHVTREIGLLQNQGFSRTME